jgi:endonuclease-3
MPAARPSRKRGPAFRPSSAERRRATRILDILEKAHPEAECALHHRNAYELVVATILSAQCTDERVNLVTPELFRIYPDASALAGAAPSELESVIRSTGFFRAKARSLIGCAQALLAHHDGQVPRQLRSLVALPGIGRKTANVVLGHAFGIAEGIAVDTHVLRVSNRLGIARGSDPVQVEAQLMALVPPARWTRTTDLLIFHGRKICDARKPRCGECPVFRECRWEDRQAYAFGSPPARKARVTRPTRRRARP